MKCLGKHSAALGISLALLAACSTAPAVVNPPSCPPPTQEAVEQFDQLWELHIATDGEGGGLFIPSVTIRDANGVRRYPERTNIQELIDWIRELELFCTIIEDD